MKKHEFTVRINTGDVLAAGSLRGIRNNIRAYFSVVPGAYYALIMRDNKPYAFAWKTPRGVCTVPVRE